MKVGARGSDVTGFTISYEADGQPYELVVPWRMVGCGSDADPEMCSEG